MPAIAQLPRKHLLKAGMNPKPRYTLANPLGASRSLGAFAKLDSLSSKL